GTTFARNHYGNYARARTKPVNPKTDAQNDVRAALAAMTARWSQVLDAPQRTAWNLYGSNVVMKNKLGESINLTGFNHYIRSNVIRQVSSEGPIDDGPTVFEIPAADPTLTVSYTEAPQHKTVTFDNTMDWAKEDGANMYLFDGQPQNAQRNFFAGPWKGVQEVAGVDPGGAVSPVVAAIKFVVTEGQHCWMYARISRADGRLSAPFRADALVSAGP
ncbi:unnamed protein product, partial [marine sediment metagenome]